MNIKEQIRTKADNVANVLDVMASLGQSVEPYLTQIIFDIESVNKPSDRSINPSTEWYDVFTPSGYDYVYATKKGNTELQGFKFRIRIRRNNWNLRASNLRSPPDMRSELEAVSYLPKKIDEILSYEGSMREDIQAFKDLQIIDSEGENESEIKEQHSKCTEKIEERFEDFVDGATIISENLAVREDRLASKDELIKGTGLILSATHKTTHAPKPLQSRLNHLREELEHIFVERDKIKANMFD